MSRVRNANDFLERFSEAKARYEYYYRTWIEKTRAKYEDNGKVENLLADSLTEAHIRQYFIDPLLNSLNWHLSIHSLDQFPNLIPEAQIQSSESGNVCFLDYFGLENDGTPLLILEAKRPNIILPKRIQSLGNTDILLPSEEPVNSVVCAGLQKVPLTGKWNDYLEQLKKYVISVLDKRKVVPKRVILTNGNWLIIFKDPADSFLETGTYHLKNVLVYTDRNDIEANYKEVFDYLEHQKVLNETPPLSFEELFFHLSPNDVFQILHGLKLKYVQYPGFYENSPRINVMPVLFVRSKYDDWILVESRESHEMPFEEEKFGEHLETINNIAIDLLNKINKKLPVAIAPTTIESHFEDKEFFEMLKGVRHKKIDTVLQHDDFLIVTGQHTHYFRLQPSVIGCPHHNWAKSKQKGCSTPIAIQSRSINPRSFFITGEDQHCNHIGVESAKASQITIDNKERCGLRSADITEAFCEIWRFETRLCCRTCIFENVCTKAKIFNLPCSKVELD